jgi:hypothetical protein
MRKSLVMLSLAFTIFGMEHQWLVISQTIQSEHRFLARSQASAASLRSFLQDYLKKFSGGEDQQLRYLDAWVDLNGDGSQEVVVHIIGQDWCGSGGCTTLVLEPEGSSYRIISKITITHLPIRMLTAKSRNWKNLTVWVWGGGIRKAYEAELRFNGKSYPSNPSVPPAHKLVREPKGKIIIPDDPKAAKPLYP